MTRVRLFVRSNRVDRVGTVFGAKTHSRPAVYGNAGYYRGNTQHTEPTTTAMVFSPEDRFAIDLLRKAGIKFDTVDLSSAQARFSARLRGVKQTPTLMVRGDRSKRYVGTKAISRFLTKAQL